MYMPAPRRPKTYPATRLTRAEMAEGARLAQREEQWPRTRADCEEGLRPCPWVGCRYHLATDISPAGSLVVVWPGRDGLPDLDGMPETCALDVADRGPHTLGEIGACLGHTDGRGERPRQIEAKALGKLRRRLAFLAEDWALLRGAETIWDMLAAMGKRRNVVKGFTPAEQKRISAYLAEHEDGRRFGSLPWLEE